MNSRQARVGPEPRKRIVGVGWGGNWSLHGTLDTPYFKSLEEHIAPPRRRNFVSEIRLVANRTGPRELFVAD